MELQKSHITFMVAIFAILLVSCSTSSQSSRPTLEDAIANAPPVETNHPIVSEEPIVIGTEKGNVPPDFTLTTLDGTLFHLHSQEKPVVLYFFATWCPHCRNDFETLENVYAQYKNDLTFVAVAMDLSETPTELTTFVKKYDVEGITTLKADSKLLKDYKIKYTTTKFAIDEGKIIYTGSGEFTEEQWKILFDAMVK